MKYVEVYRPGPPKGGVKFIVHSSKHFSRDVLQPTMTCVFEVDNVRTKEQAIACCIEKLAGINTNVRKIF